MAHFLDEINAAQLRETEFPDPTWVVPGLIPEGLTLLAGPYKGNKSYWMLQLCRAVSQSHDVLYLALEDIKRRLRDREALQAGPLATSRLTFVPQGGCEKWSRGGGRRIAAWLKDARAPKLVIVDTLAKIRDPVASGNLYESDYEIMSRLKALADEHSIAMLVVHHTRKLIDDNDPFNEISSSTGLMGAADTILLLKRQRNSNEAALYVTGRDVEEARHTVWWDEATMTWSMNAAVPEQAEVDARIVAWVASNGPVTRAALARAFSAMRLRDVLQEVEQGVRTGALVEDGGRLLVPSAGDNVVPLRPPP